MVGRWRATVMEGIAIGWREGILFLLVLAVLYVIVTVLRLTRVGQRRSARPAVEPGELWVPSILSDEPERVAPPAAPAVPEEPAAPAAPAAAALSPAPTAHTAGFGEHLAEHLARSEMEMEVQRMRTEMERMRAEMEELRVARHVSPQYAEAMELAQRGLTAQDMADQLGISLAEAELVQALSRSDGNFDEGEQYGEDAAANHDGFNAFNRPTRHSGG